MRVVPLVGYLAREFPPQNVPSAADRTLQKNERRKNNFKYIFKCIKTNQQQSFK